MTTTADEEEQTAVVTIPHIRSADYQHIDADGAIHRFYGDKVVATFYLDDRVISSESFTVTDGSVSKYNAAGVDDKPQRVDLVTIRMDIEVLFFIANAAQAYLNARQQDPDAPQPDEGKGDAA